MTFSYAAGTSTPTYAGLAEITSCRINDGTFRSTHLPPLTNSAPIRDALSELASSHGGYAGTPRLGPWEFDLEGFLYVTTGPDDVQAAIDYLRSKFTVAAGLLTLTLNAKGWSATRQMTVRVARGGVTVVEPDVRRKKVPRRDFTVPLIAPDPRVFSTTLHSTTIGTGATAVSNAGTFDTPFVVRFNGPLTNPRIDGPGAATDNRIRVLRTIASGDWVEVNTRDPQTGTMTAVDNTGANAIADVANSTARVITPGSTNWTKSGDVTTGTVTISHRDAWA